MRLLLISVFLCFSMCSMGQSNVSADTSIYRSVDVIAQFKGGAGGWQRFLEKNMNIDRAIEEMDSTQYVEFGLKQTAILEFTVCEDGEICDFEVVNKSKISPAFAEEALRVIQKSTKWIPAVRGEKAVRSRIRQPIVAILTGDY